MKTATALSNICIMSSLAAVFGSEFTTLRLSDQALLVRDCVEDGGVDDFAQYRNNIGRGNLLSYVKCQRVRFGVNPKR